jgi:hypothetical protein
LNPLNIRVGISDPIVTKATENGKSMDLNVSLIQRGNSVILWLAERIISSSVPRSERIEQELKVEIRVKVEVEN